MRINTAFLFDLDGVIVDTAVFHYQAWKRLANSLGFDISKEFNENLKGISRTESLDLILRQGGLDLSEARKAELAALKNEWYLDLVRQMRPDDLLPGVADFFAQVKEAGIKTALGSVSKNARLILDQIGMTPAFDAIIDGTNITRSKPDPEVFLKGAEALGAAPADCIVFEDAVAGIEAARRARMRTVGIGSLHLLDQADLVVASFEGLTIDTVLSLSRPPVDIP